MLTFKLWGDELLLAFAAFAGSTDAHRGVSKAVMVDDELRAAFVGLRRKPGASSDKNEVCARLHVSRRPVARRAEKRLVEVATAIANHLDAVMAELRKFAARQPDLFEP